MVAAGKVSRSGLQADGGAVYWCESRPEDGGRQVVVRCRPAGPATRGCVAAGRQRPEPGARVRRGSATSATGPVLRRPGRPAVVPGADGAGPVAGARLVGGLDRARRRRRRDGGLDHPVRRRAGRPPRGAGCSRSRSGIGGRRTDHRLVAAWPRHRSPGPGPRWCSWSTSGTSWPPPARRPTAVVGLGDLGPPGHALGPVGAVGGPPGRVGRRHPAARRRAGWPGAGTARWASPAGAGTAASSSWTTGPGGGCRTAWPPGDVGRRPGPGPEPLVDAGGGVPRPRLGPRPVDHGRAVRRVARSAGCTATGGTRWSASARAGRTEPGPPGPGRWR